MSVLTFDSSADPILQRRRQIQEGAAASLRRRKVYSKVWVGVCWAFLVIAIIPLVARGGLRGDQGTPGLECRLLH